MNYTTISINGETVNLRFGMASFRYLSTKDIKEFDEIGVSHILYSGYYNWCLVNEIVPALKFADFVDYVEMSMRSDVSEINAAMKVWSDNQLLKDAVDDGKKKKISRKSKGSHSAS